MLRRYNCVVLALVAVTLCTVVSAGPSQLTPDEPATLDTIVGQLPAYHPIHSTDSDADQPADRLADNEPPPDPADRRVSSADADIARGGLFGTSVNPDDSPLLRDLQWAPRPPVFEVVVYTTHDQPPLEQTPVAVPSLHEMLRGAPALNMLLIFALGLIMAHYGARSLRLRR